MAKTKVFAVTHQICFMIDDVITDIRLRAERAEVASPLHTIYVMRKTCANKMMYDVNLKPSVK